MDFIDDLGLIQKIYLLEIYLSVSFWEYVSFQKKTNTIKYNIEYGYYSLIQWLAIAIGLLSIFGIFTGFLLLGFCLIALQYLSHFTFGLILDQISKYNKEVPSLLFGANIWVLVLFTLYIFKENF
tara:strand:- start:555 stop:929 length:375 start_codon:yes stop_codon:yes gene_type:complete